MTTPCERCFDYLQEKLENDTRHHYCLPVNLEEIHKGLYLCSQATIEFLQKKGALSNASALCVGNHDTCRYQDKCQQGSYQILQLNQINACSRLYAEDIDSVSMETVFEFGVKGACDLNKYLSSTSSINPDGEKVFVHCRAGMNRSVTIILFYCMLARAKNWARRWENDETRAENWALRWENDEITNWSRGNESFLDYYIDYIRFENRQERNVGALTNPTFERAVRKMAVYLGIETTKGGNDNKPTVEETEYLTSLLKQCSLD